MVTVVVTFCTTGTLSMFRATKVPAVILKKAAQLPTISLD